MVEQDERVRVRRAVLEREHREAAHRPVRVGVRERGEQRTHRVHHSRVIAREQLEREQRRPAAGRALVLEPSPQELGLGPEAQLADRAEGDRSLRGSPRCAPRPRSPRRRRDGAPPARARPSTSAARAATCARSTASDDRRERAARPGRRTPPTAGSASLSASARGCAPTSRRSGSTRTSRASSAGGISATSSTTADQNSTFVASTRSGWRARELGERRVLERLGDVEPRRAELPRGAAQHARPRILGPVDPVAEAHQTLACRRGAPSRSAPRSPRSPAASSIGSTRAGAPPWSGPERAPTAERERRGAVGAGRGDDARGEGRGVHPVLGRADPVRVDRGDMPRVGLAPPLEQEPLGRGRARRRSSPRRPGAV